MVWIVEMARDNRLVFSCHRHTWLALQELAKAHGWAPAGTLPDGDGYTRYGEPHTPDYQPEEWLYAKAVTAADAAAWADALTKARPALQAPPPEQQPMYAAPLLVGDGMTSAEFMQANAPASLELIDAFIAFLRGGAFAFAWDD